MIEPGSRERAEMIHDMLQRLAGTLPDDLMAQARQWLAAGSTAELARAVFFTVLDQRIPVTPWDADVLEDLLDEHDIDLGEPADLAVTDAEQPPQFDFNAEPPDGSDPNPDGLDEVAVSAIAEEPAARGLWRVWRTPDRGLSWPPPRRLFLIEVAPDADRPELAARMQDRLAGAGEWSPQVEVFVSYHDLPAYQRIAWASGELLWSSADEAEIRMAVLFDEVDAEAGPSFSESHRRVEDEEERAKLIGYLRSGTELLFTTARMDDVVDRTQTESVPMNFHTDGRWIWTDATTYYLEQHLMEPDPDLVEHIRGLSYTMAEPDGVGVHRAMTVLQTPPAEEPAWTFS